MNSTNKIYRYPSNLQIAFPEGLKEIRFLKEIEGFNYISVTKDKKSKISLPVEFKESSLPEDFLEKKRQEKYAEIEGLRKELQFQPIKYQESEFSASQMARQNILGVIEILRSNNEEMHYWQDVKGNSFQFSYNDFRNIINSITSRDTKLYSLEIEVRNAIKNESDITALESLKVTDLWNQLSS